MEKLTINNQKSYNVLLNAKNNKKLSHAYLIECKNPNSKKEVHKFISKLILCESFNGISHDNCDLCKKIDNEVYPEIDIIETETGSFKIDQLKKIQSDMSKKAIYSNSKIYVILDAEKTLEKGSNSLLKFIEEPQENVYAILITDNIYKIIKTIRSRCQILKFKDAENLLEELIDKNYSDEIFDRAFDFLIGLNEDGYIARCKEYTKKESQDFYYNFYELMVLILNIIMKKKIGIYSSYGSIKTDKFVMLDENYSLKRIKKNINYLNKEKIYIRNNINISLLLDKTIIELGGKYD